MVKVVCQSQVSSQSWLGVVSFSIGKKIRKCLAEVTCYEIRNWALVTTRPFSICLLVHCLKSSVNRFSCGIGKSTVDDGSLADSSFAAEASSYECADNLRCFLWEIGVKQSICLFSPRKIYLSRSHWDILIQLLATPRVCRAIHEKSQRWPSTFSSIKL